MDEYKVSETDLPSSQPSNREDNTQDKDHETSSHSTTVRKKSILHVMSYTLGNVIESFDPVVIILLGHSVLLPTHETGIIAS